MNWDNTLRIHLTVKICIICLRAKHVPFSQIMGDLLAEGTNAWKLFNVTGLESFGPFLVTYKMGCYGESPLFPNLAHNSLHKISYTNWDINFRKSLFLINPCEWRPPPHSHKFTFDSLMVFMLFIGGFDAIRLIYCCFYVIR